MNEASNSASSRLVRMPDSVRSCWYDSIAVVVVDDEDEDDDSL
jgi:hypothetical protein